MRRAGYSLVEVLIAFVILTLVLSALIPDQAALLRRTTFLQDRLLAHDYALSRAARLGYDLPLEVGVTDDDYRGWQIRTEVQPGDPTTGDIATLLTTITVFAQSGQSLARHETIRTVP